MASFLYVNGQQIPSGYTITVYKYEPFSYLFTPPPPVGSTGYLVLSSTSTLLTSLVRQASLTDIEFNSPGYLPWDPQTRGYTGATSTAEQIVIGYGTSIVSGGGVIVEQTATVNVIIKAGRFVLPALTSPSYNLFVNEPIASTLGSAIRFQAPGNLAVTTPFTTPALPPGLSFVPVGASPNLNWDLTGTPLTGFPPTSYTIYARGASNTSFVISKTIAITVGSERVVTGASPSSNISMTVGTPITTTVITASYPNSFSSNLAYAWSFLPDGLQFTDGSGNPVTSPFRPADSNSTMLLSGTPTESAAQLYRGVGVSNITTNIVATRQTAPALTATQPLNLSFGPTVLFDTISIPRLYVNDPIDTSSISVQANTYFPFSSGMASIVAPTLPAGLTLDHTPGNSVAYLSGTPTAVVSNSYAITATNSNGISQTSNATIQVAADTISFTGPATDTCYNFVISRPLAQSLTGYYPSNITYTATTASGANVNLSVTNLSNVGISTTIVGSSLALGGIPDTVTGLTTAVITATAPTTGATSSINLKYEILTDDISLTNPVSQVTFFQNQEITPIQITASTLSDRPVVNWSSSNLPAGLSLSTTGRLTGTPADSNLGSTFDVVASTGYVSDTNSISYKTVRDDILIALIEDPSVVSSSFSNVELRVITYSGASGNVAVQQSYPSQPSSITLGISGNNVTGDLGTASVVLPEYRFILRGSAGNLDQVDTVFSISVRNSDIQRRFMIDASQTVGVSPPSNPFTKGVVNLFANEDSLLSFGTTGLDVYNTSAPANWTSVLTTSNTEFGQIGQFGQSSNVCMLTSGKNMYRSTTNGSTWALVSSSDISTISGIVGAYFNLPPIVTTPGPILSTIASDGNSNWLALGNGYDSNVSYAQRTVVRTSSNDGLTWRDVSLSSPILATPGAVNASSLYYNSGRYFLANGLGSNSYRADVSTLGTWEGPLAIPPMPANVTVFGFSNNTVLAGAGATLYKSTDNGTNWTTLAWGGTGITDIQYVGATRWYISDSNGLYVSTDATNFSNVNGINYSSLGFDGASLYSLYSSGGLRSDTLPFDSNWGLNTALTNLPLVSYSKLSSRIIRSSNIVASISAASALSSFLLPTARDYAFLQFAGVNIPIDLAPSSNFIYYYATELPQGLRLALDTSGISADISGIPTLYDPNPRRSFIFAREPITDTVTPLVLTTRVLSPFVLKPQTSAAGYTAYLRQYVEVNGAQNARDAVAFPVQENPIGKFTSPGIGDVVTDSNCPC